VTLPADDRVAAAYRCWTRKEAYAKGLGVGLRVPPATLEVWEPGDGVVRLDGWAVHRVAFGSRYAAAVAGEASECWAPGAPARVWWSPIEKTPPGNIDR
jgi:hypothetical protein